MKPRTPWRFRYDDATQATGEVPRARVAYLLKAARSRGATIARFPRFYRIGDLYLYRPQPADVPAGLATADALASSVPHRFRAEGRTTSEARTISRSR
jgi:hypothetical protein